MGLQPGGCRERETVIQPDPIEKCLAEIIGVTDGRYAGPLSRSYNNKLSQTRFLTGPIAIQPPHDLPLPLNLCNKFLLAREIEGIPGCKELAAVIEN